MSRLRSQAGFSLLEVMIAFAIIVVIVFATVITQSGSVASSARNKNVIIATNLARNLINEQELLYEGLDFEHLPKSKTETFPEPKEPSFKWTIAYDEIDFAPLTELLASQSAKENEKGGDSNGQTEMLLRVFKEYLGKSVRRMTVTIEWPEGTGTSTQTFTQLLVNYDTEFKLSI